MTKIQYLIRNIDREFAKQLNFKGIKFPVQNKDYPGGGGGESILPYLVMKIKIHTVFILQKSFEKHVHLLLTSIVWSLHYVLIKAFDSSMTNKTRHDGKKDCRYCLKCFRSSKILENHIKVCLAINYAKRLALYEENTYTRFQNLKKLLKASCKIYADFESILKHATDIKRDGRNTEKFHGYIVYSYGYKLVCVDKQYSRFYKFYFGEDTIDKFINDITNRR